jgi:hypothetical protein
MFYGLNEILVLSCSEAADLYAEYYTKYNVSLPKKWVCCILSVSNSASARYPYKAVKKCNHNSLAPNGKICAVISSETYPQYRWLKKV